MKTEAARYSRTASVFLLSNFKSYSLIKRRSGGGGCFLFLTGLCLFPSQVIDHRLNHQRNDIADHMGHESVHDLGHEHAGC
jgi:hypothetical protein